MRTLSGFRQYSLWGSRSYSSTVNTPPKVQFMLMERERKHNNHIVDKGATHAYLQNPSKEYLKSYELYKNFALLVFQEKIHEAIQFFEENKNEYSNYAEYELAPSIVESIEHLALAASRNKDVYYKHNQKESRTDSDTIINVVTPEFSFYSSVPIPEEIFWELVVKRIEKLKKDWDPHLHMSLSSFPVLVTNREKSSFNELFCRENLFGGLNGYPIALNTTLQCAQNDSIIWAVKHTFDKNDPFYELAGPNPEADTRSIEYKNISPRNAIIRKTSSGKEFISTVGVCRDSLNQSVSIPMHSLLRYAAMLEDPTIILSFAGMTTITSDTADRLKPDSLQQNSRIQITSIPFSLLAHADAKKGGQVSQLTLEENTQNIRIVDLDGVRVPLTLDANHYLSGASLVCFSTVDMGGPTEELQANIRAISELTPAEKEEYFGQIESKDLGLKLGK